MTYFAAPDPAAFAPDRFPIWIWMDDPSFYGFPTYGEAGPKAAEDVGGDEVDAGDPDVRPQRGGYAPPADFLADHLPGALGPEIYTKTCLYTLTPDRDFVVDRAARRAGRPRRARARRTATSSPRSSAAILAELRRRRPTPSAGEIERFAIDRPILLEASPVTSFMV